MDIIKLVNERGCFDLQFRRDVRHKRTGTPTYYSWRAQFVVVGNLDKEDLLKQIQSTLNCGKIHYITEPRKSKAKLAERMEFSSPTGIQLRYSVQDIKNLHEIIIPFFKENPLSGNKKKDFELWAEAVKILYQNKGKHLSSWPKETFLRLIEIQKLMQKYKARKLPVSKWLPVAEAILKHLT